MNAFAYVLGTHVEHIFFFRFASRWCIWQHISLGRRIAYRVFTIPFPLDTLTGDTATECVRTSLQ